MNTVSPARISSCHAELMLVAHQAGVSAVTMNEFVQAARLRGESERRLVEAQVRYLTDEGMLYETGGGYSLGHWGDLALDGAAQLALQAIDEVTDVVAKGLDVDTVVVLRMLQAHPALTRSDVIARLEAVGVSRAAAVRQLDHLSLNPYGPPLVEGKRRLRLGELGWRLLDVMSVQGAITLKV